MDTLGEGDQGLLLQQRLPASDHDQARRRPANTPARPRRSSDAAQQQGRTWPRPTSRRYHTSGTPASIRTDARTSSIGPRTAPPPGKWVRKSRSPPAPWPGRRRRATSPGILVPPERGVSPGLFHQHLAHSRAGRPRYGRQHAAGCPRDHDGDGLDRRPRLIARDRSASLASPVTPNRNVREPSAVNAGSSGSAIPSIAPLSRCASTHDRTARLSAPNSTTVPSADKATAVTVTDARHECPWMLAQAPPSCGSRCAASKPARITTLLVMAWPFHCQDPGHQSYMRTVEGTVVTIPNGAVVPQATTILRPASGNQGIVKLLQSNAL